MNREPRWVTPLPHRLEAHSEASWWMPTDDVKRECTTRGIDYTDLVGSVSLGTGHRATARRKGHWSVSLAHLVESP